MPDSGNPSLRILSAIVEVKDSDQTGYLVPGRDGPGALPNGESC